MKNGMSGGWGYTPLKKRKGGGRCRARTERGSPCPEYAEEGYTRCRRHHGLCKALTKAGKPCRGGKLRGGRCKWHGGLSTGPRTVQGKSKVAMNFPRVRAKTGAG